MKSTMIDHDELLEEEADVAREHLTETVDELEVRKKRVALLPLAAGALGSFWLTANIGKRVRRWNARRRRRAQWRRLLRVVRLR
jgi:hypothetical protein